MSNRHGITIVKTPTVALKIIEDVSSDDEEDEVEDNVGRFVWPTAVPMLRHMMSSKIIHDGPSLFVELGAGCGVLGMGLAAAASVAAEETSDPGRNGSNNQSPNQKLHIILTDHDDEWLQRNVALNKTLLSETSPAAATMEVTRLDWRNPHDIEAVQHMIQQRLSSMMSDNDDCNNKQELVIVASDVLYNHETHKDLAYTLHELTKAAQQSTRIIIGFPDRDDDEEHFRPFARDLFGEVFVPSKPMVDDRKLDKGGKKMDLRVIDFCVERSNASKYDA